MFAMIWVGCKCSEEEEGDTKKSGYKYIYVQVIR
jgi:hypothetical protein